MSSILDNPAIRNVALKISVEQYHRLGDAGVIAKNTELLRGVVVEKMVKSPWHSWLVQCLAELLRPCVGKEAHLRQEQPLTLRDSEPEPDLAVVDGAKDDWRHMHPPTAILVIEVAVSSAAVDRAKAIVYAEAGVQEYWMILAEDRAVETFSSPAIDGYRQWQRYGVGDSVASTSVPAFRLSLAVIFPNDE